MAAGWIISEKERDEQPCRGCGVLMKDHFTKTSNGKMWIPCKELQKKAA